MTNAVCVLWCRIWNSECYVDNVGVELFNSMMIDCTVSSSMSCSKFIGEFPDKGWTNNSINSTGVNPAGDAGDTSPPIFWLVGTSMGISPPILLRMFGYSTPVLVVLAQWQHLIMSFIHCFARKSKMCHRIDANPTEGAHDKKTVKLALRIHQNTPFWDKKNKKFAPSQTTPQAVRRCSQWGGEHPLPMPYFFGASSPQLWTRVDATDQQAAGEVENVRNSAMPNFRNFRWCNLRQILNK